MCLNGALGFLLATNNAAAGRSIAIAPLAPSVACAGPSCAGKLAAPTITGKPNYYISTSGSTSNSGANSSSPWPASRLNNLPTASVINFACGENFGSVTFSVAGTTNNPTIYQTDPGCGNDRAQFTNITISGSWITVYNVKVNAVGHGVTVSNGRSNVTFQGSEVSGGSGFYVGTAVQNGGTNFTLDSTAVYGSSDSGMFLYHNNSLIQYSRFYNNGGGLGYGYHHIYMESDHSVFRNNDFGSLNTSIDPLNAGQAISMRFTNEDVYSNYFHDIDEPLSWFQEDPGLGTARIFNNAFQNIDNILYVDTNPGARGYNGPPTIDIVFASNTIQGSGGTLFNIRRNTGSAVFKNNISIGQWETVINGTYIESNNLWNTATGVGPAPNFALSSGSNAIDAGTASVAGLTYINACDGTPLSYCGNAPDIGFNEFGSGPQTPVPQSVASRKTHGAAGHFDIDLPLFGAPGIECRSGGAVGDYEAVFTFASPVAVNGNPQADVTSGTGSVPNGGVVSVNGRIVTVFLTNVANAQTIGVTLFDVRDNGGAGDVTVQMGVLGGDTTGNGVVNSSDVGQTKAHSGNTAISSNFRNDVTVNGSINSSDVGLVKSMSGTGLPP